MKNMYEFSVNGKFSCFLLIGFNPNHGTNNGQGKFARKKWERGQMFVKTLSVCNPHQYGFQTLNDFLVSVQFSDTFVICLKFELTKVWILAKLGFQEFRLQTYTWVSGNE